MFHKSLALAQIPKGVIYGNSKKNGGICGSLMDIFAPQSAKRK